MPVRPMLLHRMALVSFRLFCKNLGNLQEFFGQMVYRPPLAENCPYAYDSHIEGLGLHVVYITRYVIRIKKHLHSRIEIIEIERQ